jgi:hypothetical protein
MLAPVADPWTLRPPTNAGPPFQVECRPPAHLTLEADINLEQALHRLAAHGLSFPLLAKSLWADGRPESHAMAVVHNGEE